MKKVLYLIIVLVICVSFSGCKEKNRYEAIDTTTTTEEIGNMSQDICVAANNDYIFFMADVGKIFKMNLADGGVTTLCDNPTCLHLGDCASANKTRIQTCGDKVFAAGNFEEIIGDTVVYSSFGEIVNGEYNKILEKNKLIYLPSLTNNMILSESGNEITLTDINTKKTKKRYPFNYALYLRQLYCYDGVIYFVNGLGNLYSIDLSTDKISQIYAGKINHTIVKNHNIYFIDERDKSLNGMKDNGTEKKIIIKDCSAYNLSEHNIYYSRNNETGVFKADLNGDNEEKICDLDQIISIHIFEKQNKLVCSNYEKCYIGNMDGSNMAEPKLPEMIQSDK